MTTLYTPRAEVDITPALVRDLLEDQHPDLALEPIGLRYEGWDNVTYRLGENLAVRLPRRSVGAEIADTELEWLARIGQHWPFPAPVPVRLGEPSSTYPWRWSVVPWIPGTQAFDAPLSEAGARDLGIALAHIHQPCGADAPVNPYRSRTLAESAEAFGTRVGDLVEAGEVSPERADAVRAIFAEGLSTPEPDRTWAHLDLHGGNVLTADGRLAGIVDWGDAAAGDPGTDLGQAWVLVGDLHAEALLDAYASAGGALRVGLGSPQRLRVMARAAQYAVTLASMESDPFLAWGVRAIDELTSSDSLGRGL